MIDSNAILKAKRMCSHVMETSQHYAQTRKWLLLLIDSLKWKDREPVLEMLHMIDCHMLGEEWHKFSEYSKDCYLRSE